MSFSKNTLNIWRLQHWNWWKKFLWSANNDSCKQYHKIRKVSTGQDDDYTRDCLLDYKYFKDNYRLIVADLSKQKALDPDSRAIQQILFTGKKKLTVANTRVIIH